MGKLLALMLLAAFSSQAMAEFSFDYDFDAHKKTWKEIQAQLPAAPKKENLVEFTVSATSPHHYYVDRNSVSVGADGVVRYTMVIHTAGGAEDVSYEGMRCDTVEAKVYAFGRADGQWERNQYAVWRPIVFRIRDGYQAQLFTHYFCAVGGAADMAAIRRALDSGGLNR